MNENKKVFEVAQKNKSNPAISSLPAFPITLWLGKLPLGTLDTTSQLKRNLAHNASATKSIRKHKLGLDGLETNFDNPVPDNFLQRGESMKVILKKHSQSILPLIEKCDYYIRDKVEKIFYSKEKKCYVDDTQKKVVLTIKLELKE